MEITKHILKKYYLQDQLSDPDLLPNAVEIGEGKPSVDYKAAYRKMNLILISADRACTGFIYNHSGNYFPMPIPDFTLVYFDFAYNLWKEAQKLKDEFMGKLINEGIARENQSELVFKFYGISASCVTNLFTAIESFANNIIPNDFIYEEIDSRCTKIYNKDQIQRNLDFDTKLKKVLSKAFQKDFFRHINKSTIAIENLKQMRDELIHPKYDGKLEKPIGTLEGLLKFKYSDSFSAVASLFNFFKPNYIEECPCSSTH